MSFSFAAQGKTRALLLADIAAKMAKVVEGQPVHAADQSLVNEVAGKYAEFVAEPNESEILISSVNGSVSVSTTQGVRWANVGVSVSCQTDTTAP
jgi:tetrahydromethanopterin S-methyltransferase subunit H